MGENIVPILGRHVTGKARSMLRLVSRFSDLVKLRIPPPTGRCVLLRVFDHELKVPIRGSSGYEGLLAAKYPVVFRGGNVVPRESGDDRTVRKYLLALTVGSDRFIVA